MTTSISLLSHLGASLLENMLMGASIKRLRKQDFLSRVMSSGSIIMAPKTDCSASLLWHLILLIHSIHYLLTPLISIHLLFYRHLILSRDTLQIFQRLTNCISHTSYIIAPIIVIMYYPRVISFKLLFYSVHTDCTFDFFVYFTGTLVYPSA